MSEGRSYRAMNRSSCGILVAIQFVGTWVAVAQTGPGFDSSRQPQGILVNTSQATVPSKDRTNPAMVVSHRILDFGYVPVGTFKRLSFTVQNVGAGLLTGAAKVSAPFNILGGSPYALKYPQTQVITVQFAPDSTGVHMTVVHLSGGDGATVTVMGSVSPRRAPGRRRAPAAPQNLRLFATR
jgi:hypothetical protein